MQLHLTGELLEFNGNISILGLKSIFPCNLVNVHPEPFDHAQASLNSLLRFQNNAYVSLKQLSVRKLCTVVERICPPNARETRYVVLSYYQLLRLPSYLAVFYRMAHQFIDHRLQVVNVGPPPFENLA